jgi:hypothetical protein
VSYAFIDVRACNSIAVAAEAIRSLSEPLIPAGHMRDQDYSGIGTGSHGAGIIDTDLIVIESVNNDGLGHDAFIVRCVKGIPSH